MKKILIIEDDNLVASIYRNKFSTENYEVETASDGETGLESLKKFNPDLVILDLMLPTMSGLDVLTKIRSQEESKQLPVIVFSNTYLSNMVQQAWKAGATKCLSKASCTPKQVIDVVRSLSSHTEDAEATANGAALSPAQPAKPDAPAPAKSSPGTDADAAFQAELRQTYLAGLPSTITTCRTLLQAAIKSSNDADRTIQLDELYRKVHSLTANAGVAGELDLAHMGDAMEALLKELCEKPAAVTASAIRTLAAVLDFIAVLYERAIKPGAHKPLPLTRPNILVVDDEAISRRAITYALEKAKLPSTAVEGSEIALKLLAENAYDLIFLDVDMPVMNGFELCTKLRAFARNKNTPVIFVTSLTDFESRANSTMSGGSDLIAKPFLFMELAAKALIYVLRGKLAKQAQ
jgi:DNA-binding response OmpR family regulator